jgi:hypothetical protein
MMKSVLVEVQGKVTPGCSKSHIAYRFFVADGGGGLGIHFAYSPKNLEDREQARFLIEQGIDAYFEAGSVEQAKARWESHLPLKNLITVSVDDPNEHRGAAHRPDREQHLFLSSEAASPGLVQGDILPGMWAVTLSLHAIVTNYCDYTLQIWQEEEAAR